jgi:peptidoglycan hydrolase-like protein with peptidoglycan-binding domain
MTLRVCIIGNSHVAALREAWMRDPDRWTGFSATFLGAHQDLLLQTEVRDGRLIPITDAATQTFQKISGVTGIDLDAHDVFVIAGSSVAQATALQIYRDARWVGLPSLDACTDLATMAEQLISRPAALATMRAALGTRLGPRLAARLRAGTNRRIFLTAQPRVSELILKSPRPVTRLHNIAIKKGDAQALGQAFEEAAAQVLARSDTVFLPQPRETISHYVLTAQAFVKGANRLAATLDVPQAKDDIIHANGNYGALVLDQIAAAL